MNGDFIHDEFVAFERKQKLKRENPYFVDKENCYRAKLCVSSENNPDIEIPLCENMVADGLLVNIYGDEYGVCQDCYDKYDIGDHPYGFPWVYMELKSAAS